MFVTGGILRMARRRDVSGQKPPAEAPAPVRIVRTGHAPVLEQIAAQVRSSSGMTFGVRTPNGARLAPAGAAPSQARLIVPTTRVR